MKARDVEPATRPLNDWVGIVCIDVCLTSEPFSPLSFIFRQIHFRMPFPFTRKPVFSCGEMTERILLVVGWEHLLGAPASDALVNVGITWAHTQCTCPQLHFLRNGTFQVPIQAKSYIRGFIIYLPYLTMQQL